MQAPLGQTHQEILDATSPRPSGRWGAVILVAWCAVEGAVFTFALRPTMTELLSDLTGADVNPIVLSLLLWVFLTVIIAGSFACIQALNDAVNAKHVGNIVSMILVQITVALFQVLFLYRALVDSLAPWLAQQGILLGVAGTLGLACCAWIGVRGMTWYLVGRAGAPALNALLNR